MRTQRIIVLAVACVLVTTPAWSAVHVNLQRPTIAQTAEGRHIEQSVTLANAVASYALSYDAVHLADRNEISSGQWGWTTGYVPLGMTAPSQPNWYYQAFFNWYFDDESIYDRPATPTVVRESGDDGMIEYTWETPNASVSIRFAMVSGSDKLLMLGSYEPKQEIGRSYVQLICYPSFFPEPRQRAVTTSLGTRLPGDVVRMDLEQERWALYEDTSEGRPGQGSAGLVIGSADAFSSVEIPVGAYSITTTLELAPEARRFAIALYDFPTIPDYRTTREYFGRLGDAEAEALAEIAAADWDRPLPALPVDEARFNEIVRAGEEMLDRPAEIWRPDAEPLDFPWAASIPGGPLRTVIFCRRWEAWETMELARRLEMDAQHLYWDTEDAISYPRAWPYASATGIGPIPYGIAARRAAVLAQDPDAELFLVAGLYSSGVPGVARAEIAKQVAAGKGLLLVGPLGRQSSWPEELFADEAPELAEQVLAAFDWESIPGLGPEEPGRAGDDPPVRVWRHGDGRVVLLNVNLSHFSSLAPRTDLSEGILEAMDRWLGLCAQAALVASGRGPECAIDLRMAEMAEGALPVTVDPAPEGGSLRVRVQDDLGRVLMSGDLPLPLDGGAIELPTLPPSRSHFVDVSALDADGAAIGLAAAALPEAGGPAIAEVSVEPSRRTHELAPPWVDLPDGGEIECTATIDAPRRLDGAELRWRVRDVFDRLLAEAATPVPPGGGELSVTLPVGRPVTVCHLLEVALVQEGRELDFARLRFTMTVPYPYEDFTALMWTSCGGSPVIRRTDRLCYEWGADMCDPANTLRADDESAAREHAITALSGLRLVPYVTRIHSVAVEDNVRRPSLSDPGYLAEWRESLTMNARQCAPYQPAAYTLGDENYLYRGSGEVGHDAAAIEEFRAWLEGKYGEIGALNQAWGTDYGGFDAIERPMLLEEVVARATDDGVPASLAPWIDHKLFLDDSFANTHRLFADALRTQDPGAKVGWDGLLSYNWKAGYDFADLTDGLELNQTYISRWLQGELVRAFKGPDALTGKWGNRVADTEAGWNAFPWACLFKGDNSVWWWTSWGCDYVPFNPDLSQSKFGEWFYRAVAETTSGPGRLLLHGERADSPVAVVYAQRNLFAAVVAGQIAPEAAFAGDGRFLAEHEAILKGICDLGRQPTNISERQLAAGISPDDIRVLFLPLTTCISDEQVASLTQYVEAGGTLVVDGRAGLLTGDGAIRESRALDELLGVTAPAGREGFAEPSVAGALTVDGGLAGVAADLPLTLEAFEAQVLDPGLQATTGEALAEVDGTAVLVVNRVGAGRAITLNIAMSELNGARGEEGAKPRLEILEAILRGAGVEPFSDVRLAAGGRPLATHQVLFTDGPMQYLGVQQDILLPGLPDQPTHITLPEAAVVYDVRAGERVGEGAVQEWDITLSRGEPLLYALLPYEVSGVSVEAPDSAGPGSAVEVGVAVAAETNAMGHHVARLDVFAPGSDAPHRQYSQNIDCPGGRGTADIPFALSDSVGAWRLEVRDVASGQTAERAIEVR